MNWDLSKLYASFDDAQFISDMNALEAMAEDGKKLVDALCAGENTVATLHQAVLLMQAAMDLDGKLNCMVFLTLAANSECREALGPRVRLMDIESKLMVLQSALIKWIGDCENIDGIIAQDELLKEHALYFCKAKAKAEHLIDPALEETVLKLQQTGGESWAQLRDELFASVTVAFEIDGEVRKLPLPSIHFLTDNPDPEIRKRAHYAELAAYPAVEIAMAACMNGIKGEALTMAKLRKFDSVLDWMLADSRMDKRVFDALMAAMHASLPMFRRYFRLKAKLLSGADKLNFYDLTAPLASSSKQYSLDDCKNLLVDVFSKHHKPIADVMQRAFDERWIDAFPRSGKAGGAFCAGVHALKMSYVLTNFEGNFSGVSTLAHELGHAYQDSRLARVSSLLCDLPMPLAETASTFNELLLSESILENADRDTQIAILDQQICDASQVIVDILSRFLFESEVVEKRKTQTMSASDLCAIMVGAQKATFGDAMNEESFHPYMWAYKPHYYSTSEHFYNYPYAFGQLFATGLYALYREKGDAFWPVYDHILESSGAGTILEVAESAGINIADPAFWTSSLEIYSKKIDMLEALTAEN
ncbi:MAG: M3 family oligoendopeptidase [Clostridia bacterium]|nr:M3 family oligoendopeptidase [Clostridia bacterium]